MTFTSIRYWPLILFISIALIYSSALVHAEEPVVFSDANLKKSIEETLGKKNPFKGYQLSNWTYNTILES